VMPTAAAAKNRTICVHTVCLRNML
jgi:hypothetical protein